MDNKRFIDEVFNPYQEAWKLIKPLQNLSPSANDAEWVEWVKNIDAFKAKHADNPFAIELYKMLLGAGDVIGKLNVKHTG